MPRMSADEKRKSHERILREAARLMRERGVAATSVADVMQAADLTHGGFYRHFDSKEALVAKAFREAVDIAVSDLENADTPSELCEARRSYIDRYLSLDHVKDRGNGCPFPTMASELATLEGPATTEMASALQRVGELLAAGDRHKTTGSFAVLALLVGTITLARAAGSDAEARHMLEAGQAGVSVLMREGASRDW